MSVAIAVLVNPPRKRAFPKTVVKGEGLDRQQFCQNRAKDAPVSRSTFIGVR